MGFHFMGNKQQGGEVDNNVEKRKMKWKGRAELDAWWKKNCSFQ